MRARWLAAALTATLVAAGCGDDGGPSDTTAPPVRRAAVVGDSVAAGGGAPPYDPASGTCFRSPRSWPRVLDAALDDVRLVDDRSCGGATSDELLGPWPERQQPAQISAGGSDLDADLVLVTVGGTEAGLPSVLGTCVTGDCAGLASTPAAQAALAALTDRLVDEVYPALQTAHPGARIVHVGYPRVLPSPGVQPVGCPWLAPEDQDAALAIADGVEGAISTAVRRASAAGVPVERVDVSEALDGHEVCTAEPWVNGPGTPEQLHPTAEGYAAIAAVVEEALGD